MALAGRDRIWLLAGGAPAILTVALGWLFLISPQSAQTSDLRAQVGDTQSQAVLMQNHLAQLRAESKNMPQYAAELAADRAALPSASGIPDFLRTLQSIGTASGVSVDSITVGTPSTTTAPSPTPTAGGSDSAGRSSGGLSGAVYQMSISLNVLGDVNTQNAFLRELQQTQPRAVLITSIAQTAATSGTGTTGPSLLTISLLAFVAPSSG